MKMSIPNSHVGFVRVPLFRYVYQAKNTIVKNTIVVLVQVSPMVKPKKLMASLMAFIKRQKLSAIIMV